MFWIVPGMRQHTSANAFVALTLCSQEAAVLIGHISLKLRPQILLLFDLRYIKHRLYFI